MEAEALATEESCVLTLATVLQLADPLLGAALALVIPEEALLI